ncbi:uncharacterized protein [Dendrobates tinctorius]|uniref:uncharacterized protein n=1 Tax=Dendrobates tinctorius TaxID=92724 RepID=UPI003CCA4D55
MRRLSWRMGLRRYRQLILQVLHNKPRMVDGLDQTDRQVLQDLLDLLQEDTTHVNFLDLTVSNINGGISTRLFRKPTATNSLLDYTSFHPAHTRNGVPIGQFLRVRRNCTSEVVFREEAAQLTKRFRKRNYPRGSISRAYQRANGTTQDSLLATRDKIRSVMPRFITQYNSQWSQVREVIGRHWGILTTDLQTSALVPERPCITARRAPNFKDILTKSHYMRPVIGLERGIMLRGSFACGNCTICPHMHSIRDYFVNPRDGTRHRLRSYMNCKTTCVVYALICPCHQVYVGQTSQELRRRIQKHFSTINLARIDQTKGKVLTSVAAHFLNHHAGKIAGTMVVALEKISLSNRGGSPRKLLLQSPDGFLIWTH